MLSITWVDNLAAQALLRGRGYQYIGRSFWSGDGASGHCECFLYDLTPHRRAA